jgi:uncharacterized alkaline shock family protein YloU
VKAIPSSQDQNDEKIIMGLIRLELFNTEGFFETSYNRIKTRTTKLRSFKGISVVFKEDRSIVCDITVNTTPSTEIMRVSADFQKRIKTRVENAGFKVDVVNVRVNNTI